MIESAAVPDEVTALHLNHRFDVLGSGWVHIRHGMRCRGLNGFRYPPADGHESQLASSAAAHVNRPNRREAERIWSLLDDLYDPIDWHLDIKSGYRWSERLWYRRTRTAPVRGADIKVPWELARMQHLPQLATAYGCAASAHFRSAAIPFEFRNQVLDFIAASPPRFGVNWKCTMDVGIRAANWVLGFSMLRAQDVEFDQAFMNVFTQSVYEHARHIVENLEYAGGHRANHYLGNIAGLIFCAAALPPGLETDSWLAFGIRELIAEADFQFLPDGAHFESSTAYHRFALEMIVFPAAVVLGLHPDRTNGVRDRDPADREAPRAPGPFPPSFYMRLRKAYHFLRAVHRPDDRIVQIGDNDSGRMFKLASVYHRMTVPDARHVFANLDGYAELPEDGAYWMEDHLEAGTALGAVEGLLGCQPDAAASSFARAVVRTLCRHGPPLGLDNVAASSAMMLDPVLQKRAPDGGRRSEPSIVRTFRSAPGITTGLELVTYPDFGCCVYVSPRLYMVVRCWTHPPRYTSHMHNDQLGLILWIDGRELITDPGTYIYTPLPEERDRYRSVHAHDTPWPRGQIEPARFIRPFALELPPPARIIRSDRTCFEAEYEAKGVAVARRIRILDDRIVVEDWAPQASGHGSGAPPVSPGYGIRERTET
jgi:hypothetical protein